MKKLELRDICRMAKDDHGYTAQDLEDMTGIPASTIGNFFATTSKAPNVYNAGAICKVLGISMDKYFDITPDVLPEDQIEQMERDHKAELVTANLEGRIEQLSKSEKRLRISLYSIALLSVALLLALVGYMMFDYNVPYAGLIQSGQASTAAWIVMILLAVGVGVIVSACLNAMRYARKIKEEKGRGE